MSRCGCQSSACTCRVVAGDGGITVTGNGSQQAPYVIGFDADDPAGCPFAMVAETAPAAAQDGCVWIQPTGGGAGTGCLRLYRRAGGQWIEGICTDTTNRSAFFKTASAANHAVTVYQASSNGVDTASALNVVSDNPQSSTLQVRGRETNRGTVKITHEGSAAAADASAAALSIHLDDTVGGSAAQGIFLDGQTTGRRVRIRDNADQDRFEINAAGNVVTRAIPFFLTGAQVGGLSTQLGGGAGGVIGITNRTTAPTTNPVGGGVLYAENGQLRWRGSNGSITVIAPA